MQKLLLNYNRPDIVAKYYGIGVERKNYVEIASDLGISKQRVYQIIRSDLFKNRSKILGDPLVSRFVGYMRLVGGTSLEIIATELDVPVNIVRFLAHATGMTLRGKNVLTDPSLIEVAKSVEAKLKICPPVKDLFGQTNLWCDQQLELNKYLVKTDQGYTSSRNKEFGGKNKNDQIIDRLKESPVPMHFTEFEDISTPRYALLVLSTSKNCWLVGQGLYKYSETEIGGTLPVLIKRLLSNNPMREDELAIKIKAQRDIADESIWRYVRKLCDTNSDGLLILK